MEFGWMVFLSYILNEKLIYNISEGGFRNFINGENFILYEYKNNHIIKISD
jgi:hypothetical protein